MLGSTKLRPFPLWSCQIIFEIVLSEHSLHSGWRTCVSGSTKLTIFGYSKLGVWGLWPPMLSCFLFHLVSEHLRTLSPVGKQSGWPSSSLSSVCGGQCRWTRMGQGGGASLGLSCFASCWLPLRSFFFPCSTAHLAVRTQKGSSVAITTSTTFLCT